MRRGVIFSGPSLPRTAVEAAGFAWRPPARQGDVAAVLPLQPAAIGIVDGVFETVPTLRHDEILDALRRGITVYGAASIGALRAAELDGFGMIGVGAIYAAYRDGTLEDDDEVALLHAPAELDYRPLTIPMVNLRAAAAHAVSAGLVPGDAADAFLAACKGVFYKERTPDRVDALRRSTLGGQHAALQPVDRKRADAEALVAAMRGERYRPPGRPELSPPLRKTLSKEDQVTGQNDGSTPARDGRMLHGLALTTALALASCAAPAPPPPPPSPATFAATATCPDHTPFADKTHVRHLGKNGFRFQTNGYDDPVARKNYRPPNGNDDVSNARRQRLNDAFLLLPASAQSELCNVSTIFVDDDPDDFSTAAVPGKASAEAGGWAFWEVSGTEANTYPGFHAHFSSSADQGKNTFIGLAGPLVDSPTVTLAGLENDALSGLFQTGGGSAPNPLPVVSVADDSAALATAAVMLHELGHLEWHRHCFPAPTRDCTRFRQTSWLADIKWPVTGIHQLGGDLGNQRIDGQGATGIADILQDSSGKALAVYYKFGSSSRPLWTSLLAGVAPDEDFADTYKFFQLAQNKINVQISYDGHTQNAADIAPAKAQAFATMFPSSSFSGGGTGRGRR